MSELAPFELMVDSVNGETAPAGPIERDWHDALRSIAHRVRKATLKHRWFIELLGGRPHIGPNALMHLEASVAALSDTPAFPDIDVIMAAIRTFNAYVIGAARSEASELRAEFETAMNQREWQKATGPYMKRMIATGRFPNLAMIVKDPTHPAADIAFDQGLDCVLDGIGVRLCHERRSGKEFKKTE